MKILVTGGTGFIGSHTCIALLNAGHSVVIVDNLSNSKFEVVSKLEFITRKSVVFYKVDVTDEEAMKLVFEQNKFDGVIHFAGFKAVGESIEKPTLYYKNNVLSTITLANLCVEYNVNKIVFSSSATVYGDNQVPFEENMNLLPTTNPYGETKAISERILTDLAKVVSTLEVTILRYFNPIGAHESGLIGELPNGIPNNLMPYITQVAKRKREYLKVFGDDYNTIDGTGVRDYIHVVDLADGHVAAIENSKKGLNIYNLGTGKGTSVLQLIRTFEKVNNVQVPFIIVDKRPGDLPEFYADVKKARKYLKWTAHKTIEDMCKDAWKFENSIQEV